MLQHSTDKSWHYNELLTELSEFAWFLLLVLEVSVVLLLIIIVIQNTSLTGSLALLQLVVDLFIVNDLASGSATNNDIRCVDLF